MLLLANARAHDYAHACTRTHTRTCTLPVFVRSDKFVDLTYHFLLFLPSRSHSNGRLKISNPMGGSRLLTTNIDGRRLLTTTDQSTVSVLDLAPNGRDSAGGGSGDMSGGGSGNGVVGGSGSGSEVVGNGRSSGSGSRWSGGWGSNGGASVAGGGSGAEEGGDVSRPLSRKLEEYAEVIEEEMIDHNK